MEYFEQLLNKEDGRIYLPAAEANAAIDRLRAENERLKQMLAVSRAVNQELRNIIAKQAAKNHEKWEVTYTNGHKTLERVKA